MGRIHYRTQGLTAWTLDGLRRLRHRRGTPLIEVLGPRDATQHGPTLAFRVLASDGQTMSGT
jgi:selenocysteine lyase/cysteine desulfurase